MTWLETTEGRQFAAVRGQCDECKRLQVSFDAALFGSRRDRRIAQGELIDHMRDVVHMDPPRARDSYTSDYNPDRPWGPAGRPPLPSSVLVGIPQTPAPAA